MCWGCIVVCNACCVGEVGKGRGGGYDNDNREGVWQRQAMRAAPVQAEHHGCHTAVHSSAMPRGTTLDASTHRWFLPLPTPCVRM